MGAAVVEVIAVLGMVVGVEPCRCDRVARQFAALEANPDGRDIGDSADEWISTTAYAQFVRDDVLRIRP